METEIIKWIVMTVFGLFIGGGSFLMKRTISEQDEKIKDLRHEHFLLSQDLHETKRTYLHKDDFKEFKQELRGMFEEIRNDIRSLNELRK